MQTTNDDVLRAVRAAGLITAVAVCTASILSVAAKLTEPALHVGDIVKFQAEDEAPPDTGPRLLVHRTGQFGCILDLGVVRQSGGSLVVESQSGGQHEFRLHWAGKRTSADSADCGEDADLIVDSRDIRSIALAANRVEIVPVTPPPLAK